jgi:hypothetical protein
LSSTFLAKASSPRSGQHGDTKPETDFSVMKLIGKFPTAVWHDETTLISYKKEFR